MVASFIVKPRMKLLDWIPEDKLDWCYLSSNPNAIQLLETNLQRESYIINWRRLLDWRRLSGNPDNSYAIPLLEKNPDKIDWTYLSKNPNAIHLLEKYPEKINWGALSRNSNAIHLLEKYPDKINWYKFSGNPSIFEIDTIQMKIELTKKAKSIDIYK
jgi:hypothetical protein